MHAEAALKFAEGHRRRRRSRLARYGGAHGNAILTSAVAVVLVGLLAAEGVTIVSMAGLVSAHMFIGMLLIPPVALKLGSTGYRAVRYYSHSRPYRELGPPRLPLRLLAPILVASMLSIFVTGVLLLAAGRKAGALLEIHKVSFILWLVPFVPHLLSYIPRTARSLGQDWSGMKRQQVPGSSLRATLIAMSIGGGVALAFAVLNSINAWQA